MAKDKEETQEQEGGKKKGKGKLLIIVIAIVVLIVAGVAVKMFVFGGKKETPKKAKTEHAQQQETQQEETPEPAPEPTYGDTTNLSHLTPVEIGPIIVNLADVGGDRYLKIKLVLLEAKREAKKEEKEGEKTGISLEDAIVRDTIISIISSKTSDDLLSVSGKEELKNELISAINQALHRNLVRKIYFLTFIIQ
ncbi:flagellar basal body-associated FliL family protein [Hippea alviniae]|uniref:flagellar basal body-associated FliL family protein n=1 Tax=Hippea alviniae TaxID=1279027 RepID=UPI0003B40E5F|nr:flagellar basal body-associated FliL family protein [Hippea alviniae]